MASAESGDLPPINDSRRDLSRIEQGALVVSGSFFGEEVDSPGAVDRVVTVLLSDCQLRLTERHTRFSST